MIKSTSNGNGIAIKPRPVREKREKLNGVHNIPPVESLRDVVRRGDLTSEDLQQLEAGHQDVAATATGKREHLKAVDVDDVAVSKRNAREVYNVESLMQSIQEHGLQTPILIRPKTVGKAKYEIVFGARRYRAVRGLGRKTIEAFCEPMSDERAAMLRATENQQREDLNAIEKARELKQLTTSKADGGDGFTQQQVAEQLGVTQAAISNTVRLLELPPSMQVRVINQEMSATHARVALTYRDVPEVLQELDTLIKRELKQDGSLGSVKDFERLVECAVEEATSELNGSEWFRDLGNVVWKLKVGPEDVPKLRTLEHKRHWERKPKTVYVVNAHFKKLHDAALKEARAAKRASMPKAKGKAKAGKSSSKVKTPAERALSDEAFAGLIEEFRGRWLSHLCSRQLKRLPAEKRDMFCGRLLLYFAAYGENPLSFDHAAKELTPFGKGIDTRNGWAGLRKVSDGKFADFAVSVLAASIRGPVDAKSWYYGIANHELADVAKDLGVDLAEAWHAELAGPFTKQFFELHDKPRLVAIGQEWDTHVDPSKSKEAIINQLKGASARKLPRCLVEPPAKQRKQRGKK
jgi:ParB family chromosome partitioning protein